MKVFTIKSYGFGELSSLFSPDINMASASKQLKRWITANPKLLHLLQQEGWEKGHKRLTPKMVHTSFPYWENPEKTKASTLS